jgi:hypothetical protein
VVPAEAQAKVIGDRAQGVADVAAQLDALGIAVAKVDALAAVAVESYDNASWRDADPRQIDRMAHLLRVTADVAAAAVAGVGRFCILVADQQPAEAGDEWDRKGHVAAGRDPRVAQHELRSGAARDGAGVAVEVDRASEADMATRTRDREPVMRAELKAKSKGNKP